MISFDKIQEWQKRVKSKNIDTKKLYKIAKVLYGTQEKITLVKGNKGDMKKAVVKQTYSMIEFDRNIKEFISNINAVTCPSHIVLSLEILEELND
jgi:hypothetical protein